MPRHNSGAPPSDEPAHAGRRLSAAVGTGGVAGLLGEPPLVSRSGEGRNPDDSAGGRGLGDSPGGRGLGDSPGGRGLGDSPGSRGLGDSPGGRGLGDSPGGRGPRIRWRTGLQAAALLSLVAAALLGWFWWQAANVTAAVGPLSSVDIAETGDEPAAEANTGVAPTVSSSAGGSRGDAAGKIVVHVAGAVVRAGIVELPQGSRLHEAIAAAGGSAPDADPGQLNLAAVLQDGQKVLVPRQGETVPPGTAPTADSGAPGSPAGGAGSAPAAGKINLNTAGADELATLPRVGPVLAQRIVDWRTQHGHFQRVEELDAVDGVGPKLLAALLPLVRV